MTTQPPLPLIPADATEISAAAAMIEDSDGGRVFVHGNLCFAWDAGDIAGRRWAAVSLVRIKAATQVQVAAAFGTSPLTVWRWAQALSQAGVSALVPQRSGPRRASKLTTAVIDTITGLREQGLSLRAIGDRVAVSEASVRRALSDTDTESVVEPEPKPVVESESECERSCTATGWDVSPQPLTESGAWSQPAPTRVRPAAVPTPGQVPVLAIRPHVRSSAKLARFRLIPYAPPVFTPCARAPLAGLLLGLPALSGTGLIETAHQVYGELPNGFYSLDAMLCEGVFRALLGHARAEAATRIDPVALGRVLGLDPAPEVKTIRRKIGLLAAAGRAGDWITAMARSHVQARPEQAAVAMWTGMCAAIRAPAGSRKPMCRG